MHSARIIALGALLALLLGASAGAQVDITGFLQGLHAGSLEGKNPATTELPASESRLQLKLEHFGDRGEVFARVDYVYDGSNETEYDWELREGYLKFRLGSNIDVKAGRQILTWGTGDLIFINDVFAKDYQSFFIGRDDQYLKAPQDAIRIEYYNSLGNFNLVYTPRFEPNRFPVGGRLSYYNPFAGDIVGEDFPFEVVAPDPKVKNGEIAARYQRQIGAFAAAGYFYTGYYKNPMGALPVPGGAVAVYPRLNLFGASLRGAIWGGVLWLEGGYYDSRDDADGDNPMMPNSSMSGLFGFERQVATNLTANLQWQVDAMMDYDKYEAGQMAMGGHVRDEIRHLLTTRITKLLSSELLMLQAFMFYSPTDEDGYLRLIAEYKYTDEIKLTAGGNFFDGRYVETDFGQYRKNDNVYMKLTYGF